MREKEDSEPSKEASATEWSVERGVRDESDEEVRRSRVECSRMEDNLPRRNSCIPLAPNTSYFTTYREALLNTFQD